ncbi:MAG: hypothetical protein IJZ77_05725 [Bacilli bacterium]|nr:hypothetical protein [Bacilli bacterium]
MNKFKAFFAKVGNYIKNTAWIQPLLIVVIIFVALFSLAPLTEAISAGWTSLTTVNHMEKITYGEYVEKVNEQAQNEDAQDFIVVFSQKGCEFCPSFYKSMNAYLDSNSYSSADFKIYNVDLSTKSSKAKINGTKYTVYKDSTCGLVSPASNTKEEIIAQDYIKQLDDRLAQFKSIVGDSANTDFAAELSSEETSYRFVSTPLVIWYQNGLESRVCNNFTGLSYLEWTADQEQVKNSSFKQFIQDFGGDTDNTLSAEEWVDDFDLTYSTLSNIKDAF